MAINDKKSVKHSRNSRKNIMLDMKHIDPFFKRSESDKELINSRSDRNGIEGNQPHHSFLSLSRLSFLSLLELLGFFMLAIFIGMTLVLWNLIFFFVFFVKFMFSKRANIFFLRSTSSPLTAHSNCLKTYWQPFILKINTPQPNLC